MSNSFTVSLQVWHPDADPESLVKGIGMSPKVFWKAGDDRKTPDGSNLQGRRRESYCLFELEDGNGRELSEYLTDMLRTLSDRADFIWKLRQAGGSVSFFYHLGARRSPWRLVWG